jgi:integrase
MSKQLVSVLTEHSETRSTAASKLGWKEFPPWVFFNSYGTPLDPNNLRQRVFYKAIEAAGLRKFRIHDLRHTFATLLIGNGESLAYLRDQLGHHSIQITVDIYGHLLTGTNRQAVDRLDDYTGQATWNPSVNDLQL